MKSTAAAQAAWCSVTTTNPADLDRDGVAQLLGSISAVRAACDAAEVLAVRRTRELNAAGTSEPAEHLLANQTGRSSKAARNATQRESACEAMPALEAGLASGNVSAGHLDVAAAAHAKLPDTVAEQFAAHAADLATRSQHVGVDEFERECRDLARHLASLHDPNAEVDELERQRAASSVKRWVDKATGMHHTLISLDPLRDSTMWKVINHQVARERQQRRADGEPPLPFAALQASAVVVAVTGTRTRGVAGAGAGGMAADGTLQTNTHNANTPAASQQAGPPGSSPDHADAARSCNCATTSTTIRLPEISILCDYDTLATGIRSAGGVCETDTGSALPPDTVRRLACDANIIPMVMNSAGEVLDQGRRARTATPAQRNTLAAMHRTCAFPGCTIDFSNTRMHHVRWWWEHTGPTDIDNLLPVCEKHHHLVHEGGWGLILKPDRTATWSRPNGTIHHTGTTLDRRPRDVPMQT